MTYVPPANTIPLRFQRAELENKAALTELGLLRLREMSNPVLLIDALRQEGNARDAVYALAMMLPHRQAVWWSCLAVRLLPDLSMRPSDLAAVEIAERWVRGGAPADAERANELAEACDTSRAPAWTAMGAFWSGPSLAPRGQEAVAPAPHLPGVAVRTALLLLAYEPAMTGRGGFADWLEIGLSLMHGENGRQAQAALRTTLFSVP